MPVDCTFTFLFTLLQPSKRPNHIRLAGTDPDIPDQYIFEYDIILPAFYRQVLGIGTGGHCFEPGYPGSILPGFCSHSLSVECLPDDIPNHIEVDVSILEEADQSIHVEDIVLGEGITVLNHPEQLVAKINIRHIEREIEAEEAEIAEEGEGEAVEEEPAEDDSSED